MTTATDEQIDRETDMAPTWCDGITVEIEGVVAAVTAASTGQSAITILTEQYTQAYPVDLRLALKAMRLGAVRARFVFAYRDGRMVDIERADVPAFDASRRCLTLWQRAQA